MSDDVARRLARLEAERDVAALMARYARLVDEGPDADAIAELFTADAVYETFGFLGREPGADPIRGREALRARAGAVVRQRLAIARDCVLRLLGRQLRIAQRDQTWRGIRFFRRELLRQRQRGVGAFGFLLQGDTVTQRLG